MSCEAEAWVIEAVGTAPPTKTAAADPSAIRSTAPACVALSGLKSSYVIPCAARRGPTKYSKPAPAGPTPTRLPRRSSRVSTSEPAGVMNSATFGARVITARIGYALSQPSPPRTAK